MTSCNEKKLVVATRLHLGNAKAPPEASQLEELVVGFAEFASTSCLAAASVIAVEATTKVEGYDYVQAVTEVCRERITDAGQRPRVLPVTPWGKFVPALNALVAYATKNCHADLILFVSAETQAPRKAIETLCQKVSPDDTLVAGALLSGHTYYNNSSSGDSALELTGRTTPWNTLAVWKLSKLALTGFQLVSEGLLTDDDSEPSFGVEEVIAIATLQKLLGSDNAKAKLVQLPDVEWDETFQHDEERRQWHEKKMNSKVERAERQLKLMELTGTVYHC